MISNSSATVMMTVGVMMTEAMMNRFDQCCSNLILHTLTNLFRLSIIQMVSLILTVS
jgi:hypothetical protein